MQYRIKETEKNETTYYYPQWKKHWFWHRFVWWGGEDGTFPHTVFCTDISDALLEIERDKEERKEKALKIPKKTVYHYIDDQAVFNPNNQPLKIKNEN